MPDAMIHPTLHELADFGLGKLPERAAAIVAAHLDSCPACRKAVANVPPDSFLDKVRAAKQESSSFPPGLAEAGNAPSSVSRPSMPAVSCPDVPPELVRHPKYLILRKLGRGGMGVVYQARHKEMNRQVVIKVINRALLDRPDTLERFHREVRAAALLSHPNIVAAYDAERVGDSHMLVMEFVPGQSLAEVLQKKGPLPIANACNYMRQVALGLQHAHKHNMVHRDIKPQNLMLTPKGQVKILDFGLAKVVSERGMSEGLTPSDACMGTPEYIAPEQAKNARTADIRADLYSLGCTLYYLLAGRPPFREDTWMNTVLAHIQKVPRPLPELRPEVPAELWQVVARLMAKKPAQRFQKPLDVAQALVPFIKAGAKQDAKGGTMLPQGAGSPGKGTVIAADTGEIKKILRDVPAKIPPQRVPAKEEAASPFADLTDAGAAPQEVVRAVAKSSRKACWKRPGVLAAAIGVSLALILMAVIIMVKTPEGTIVLKDLPEDAVVTVDGNSVTVKWVDGKTAEIHVAAGKKQWLEVKKGGFKIRGEEVELDAGECRPIRVSMLPKSPAIKPPRPDPERVKKDKGFLPLFNGKDLDGWNPSPDSTWRVNESGALIGSGATSSSLFSERGDFADFHLRAEVMLGDGFNSRFLFRASGETHYGVMIAGEPGPAQFPWPTGSLFREDTGEEGLSIAPKVDLQRGKWFKLEILAQGAHIKVFIDDVMVVDYTATDNTRSQGAIGLTRRPRSVVKFRKIEIKELP